MRLDINKAYSLYSEIAKNKFRYSIDIKNYNISTAVMDRLIDSVKNLNNIDFGENITQSSINSFILWIDYAYLMLNCFEKLAKEYGFELKQKENILFKYHNLSNKNDNDYFKFIRAIILPHSLSLDDKKQKAFTNNCTAYCPTILWRGNQNIIINYLTDDVDNNSNYIEINIKDFEDFIEDLYINNIESIKCKIIKCKNNEKAKINYKISLLPYDYNDTINKKVDNLKQIIKSCGNIEDKKGISALSSSLLTAQDIMTFNYLSEINKLKQDYEQLLNKGLDELYLYLKDNNYERFKNFYYLVVPNFNYSIEYSEFNNCGYLINKLACEHNIIGTITEKIYLQEWLNELRPYLKKYSKINSNISLKELSFITIMSFVVYQSKLEVI